VQVAVASISEHQRAYAQQIAEELKKQGFRVESDLRDDKIGYKIRSLALQKLPYICVVGDKELQAGTVAVRARGGVDLGVMSLAAFSQRLRLEVEQRSNREISSEVRQEPQPAKPEKASPKAARA
jgi:threonyl-tRNA synthetase